jgi:hypothetical protein
MQKSCIDYVIQAKPMEVYVPEETSGCRYHVWRLVTSPPFENFIMLLILLNTVLLMMKVCMSLGTRRHMLLMVIFFSVPRCSP